MYAITKRLSVKQKDVLKQIEDTGTYNTMTWIFEILYLIVHQLFYSVVNC